MGKCAIKTCGLRKDYYNHALTLHRLPRNEKEKKKWLDVIGTNNINLNTKTCYICSVHFEESCFNRTLDVIRLKENSVPTLYLYSPAPEVNLLYSVVLPADNTELMIEQLDNCQPIKVTSGPSRNNLIKTEVYSSEKIKIKNPRSLRHADLHDNADPRRDNPDPLRDTSDPFKEGVTPASLDVKQRVTDHTYLGTTQTNKLNTLNTRWRALTKKLKRYRELLRRRERKMAALQADVVSLRNILKEHDVASEETDEPKIQILSSKDGVVKNKPNRQVVAIKSAVNRQKSEASRALVRPQGSTTFVGHPTREGAITSDIGKTSVGVATSVIRRQSPGLPRTIRVPKSAVKVLKTPVIRQKSDVVQKSDILQKSLVGVLPAVTVQQKSPVQVLPMSDIREKSVGNVKRTSDIAPNALVIQIDGKHSSVLQPTIVRLQHTNMDMG